MKIKPPNTDLVINRLSKVFADYDPDGLLKMLADPAKIDGTLRDESVMSMLLNLLLPDLRDKIATRLAALEKSN